MKVPIGTQNLWDYIEEIKTMSGPGPFSDWMLERAIKRARKLEQLFRLTRLLKAARTEGYEMSVVLKGIEELSKELEDGFIV